MNLSAVIVNYNNVEALESCLDALTSDDSSLLEIIVVDNASTDTSSRLVSKYGAKVKWLFLSYNRGFGGGVNAGVQMATQPYLAILNNDIEASPSVLVSLVSELSNSAGCVAIAPRLVYADGATQFTCRELPSLRGELADLFGIANRLPEGGGGYLLGEWGHKSSRMVDQVAGAAVIVSRSDFSALRGFDELFPLYFEDVDFCYRALRLGTIKYSFDHVLVHHGESTAQKFRSRTTIAIAVGRYRYFRKHRARHIAEIIRILGVLRALSRMMYYSFVGLHPGAGASRERAVANWRSIMWLVWKPLSYDPLQG